MWIESINIRGFGCLVDRRFEFPRDRAALIIADNETGKSTLAAAILAGLCGFPSRATREGRQRLAAFRPWNGDAYAVDMDITADGRGLRIERDFARDSFVVRDRDTGNDVSRLYDRDLAAHFLGLPIDDFRRIAFVCGKDTPSLGPTGGIQARLSALVEGSTEDTPAETAIAALDSARYTLDTGGPLIIDNAVRRLSEAIADKQNEIDALENGLDEAANDVRRLDEAKSQLAEARANLAQLDSDFNKARLAEQQASAQEVERAKIESAIAQTEAKLNAIDQRRAYGKKLGSVIAVGGIALALASCAMWIAQILPASPSIVGTLIGIAIAAAGAVQATRAQAMDADARLRLEREIADARAALPPLQGGDRGRMRSSTDIDAERQRLRSRIDELNDTINNLERRVGARVDAYRAQYPAIRDELHALERERARAERYGRAIAIARSVLTEVAEGTRRRWAAALNETASAILPHLNPDYDELRFDDTLAFTVRHVTDDRVLEKPDIDACLSTGAKDQIYLAVRLACCDELSRSGESIPVLLDDPLMTADDSRFARGFRYLVETYAKQHQVIILSCSQTRHAGVAREEWFSENVHLLALGDAGGCPESANATAPNVPS